MTLRSSLSLILLCCVVAAFVLVSILLLSVWAAVLVVLSVVASLAQIFGAMTLLGIKLSALPAVILILSVGMIVCFTVHISLVSLIFFFFHKNQFLIFFYVFYLGLYDLRGQS